VTEDQYIMLSALQHYLFCPRQCALIHVEQLWAENRFTAEGQVLHGKAHDGSVSKREGVKTARTLHLASRKLGLIGQCDVVEFHQDGSIIPIEYKRGKPKVHRADEVQLCAQAICLEEILQVIIPQGYLFYGLQRRRTEVVFDPCLRDLTMHTIDSIHSMMEQEATPAPNYEKKKCGCCSLYELCLPQVISS
jgi:CRISPR-associated exonuclease Cas4